MTPPLDIVDRKTVVQENTVDLLERWLEMAKAGEIQDVIIAATTEEDNYIVNSSATMSVARQLGLWKIAELHLVNSLEKENSWDGGD